MARYHGEFHSDLSLDKITKSCRGSSNRRRDTILVHSPVSGDTLGVGVSHLWSLSRDSPRTGEKLWDWFQLLVHHWNSFSVGAVPLRFCRDDADRLCLNHLRVSDREALQLDLAFGDNSIDLVWHMVVRTRAEKTEQVVLIGSTATGDNRCKFVIPDRRHACHL